MLKLQKNNIYIYLLYYTIFQIYYDAIIDLQKKKMLKLHKDKNGGDTCDLRRTR